MKMRKTFVPNFLGFLFFIMKKYLKSAPAEGGGGAIKFSAEITANKVIWQIVERTCFWY